MQKIAIIIPCYNEEKRLDSSAILTFAKEQNDIYFIMVNDGSNDHTAQIIDNLKQQSNGKILCLHLKQNRGKAEAVRQGFQKAFLMNFAVIGYWDADLATPLYEIINLYDHMEQNESEIVFGARIRLLGRKIERKQIRHYLGRVFATIVSCILRINIYDSQCGAKIFKNTPELQTVFRTPFQVDWTFDVKILARFILIAKISQGTSKIPATEYPLQEWRDISGSKLTPLAYLKSSIELIAIFLFIYAPNWKYRAKSLHKHVGTHN